MYRSIFSPFNHTVIIGSHTTLHNLKYIKQNNINIESDEVNEIVFVVWVIAVMVEVKVCPETDIMIHKYIIQTTIPYTIHYINPIFWYPLIVYKM